MLVVPCVRVVATPLLLIVATAALLEFHVAISVISVVPVPDPAHGVAVAVNGCGVPTLTVAPCGVTSMDAMQPSVTVSVAVPEIFGRIVDAAVIVVEPRPMAVASPEELMLAMVVG